MSTVPPEKLRTIVDPAARSVGLLLEDVVAVQAGRRTIVRATVDLPDGPGGVSSDAIADVTRAISAALDDADPIKGAYTLEVSTPGIDRPLTTPRHFRRAIGRKVEVELVEGTKTGELSEASDAEIFVDGEAIPFEQIKQGRMLIDFGRGLEGEE